jgi:branched-chain amino acid transport system substrate-binding protein
MARRSHRDHARDADQTCQRLLGCGPGHYRVGTCRSYASYILKERPNGKVGVLYQNDDFGKDYLKGVKDGLGDKAKAMFAVEASYETTDPTVDSLIVSMKAAGCDAFVNTAIPKFAAQAIRKAAELDWKPLHIVSSVGNSVATVLKPAGLENSKDLISDFYLKDPTDPQWKDDEGYKWWLGLMEKYYPEGDKTDVFNVYGPSVAATTVQVLKMCGEQLTRENVMKQAASLHDFTVPMLLPGIKINTSPTDFAPVKQVQMGRFNGERWQLFGELITGAFNG